MRLEKKITRLGNEIAKWFKEHKNEDLTFGELLDKYAIIGESCETVAQKFRELTRNEIKIIRSTLGYAIRLTITQNNTNFRIEAMKPGNPYRKSGSGRKPSSGELIQSIRVLFFCSCCESEYYMNIRIKKANYVDIQSITCRHCGNYGTGRILYKYNRQEICRSLINIIPGVPREVNIDPKQFRKRKETV